MPEEIVVVGLDGATLDLIQPWVDDGLLPNMARLLQEGSWGSLRSVIPPMSSAAWTTFMTGRNMAKHGIVDFLVRKPDSYELQILNATHRRSPTVWTYLSDLGKRVGVLNVPMTYPPERVEGFVVSGMDAPSTESKFAHPPELREKLLAEFPDYVIEPRTFHLLHGPQRDPEKLIDLLIHYEEERYAVGQFLRSQVPVDLFTIVLRYTDLVQHWFWKSMDPDHPHRQPGDEAYDQAILRIYQHADQLLGRYMSETKTLIVLSDHGAGPVGDRVVYLNTWLRDQGWLSFKQSGGDRGKWVVKWAWQLWRRLRGAAPRWLREFLIRRFSGVRKQLPSLFALSDIDWGRTQAYSVEVRGMVWINLKGREPGGTVSPGEEYETLREEIAERLLSLRDPITGKPLIRSVYKREELYAGPLLDMVPDLLVEWETEPHSPLLLHGALSRRQRPVELLDRDALARLTRPNGTHRLDGACILWGEHITPEGRLENAGLVDLAPTMLYLMGLPIPEDMDGRVLMEAIDASFAADHPLQKVRSDDRLLEAVEGYAEDEEKDVMDRLSDLGYI